MWVWLHHLIHKAGYLIAVPPVLGRSLPDGGRSLKASFPHHPKSIQAPVENTAHIFSLTQLVFQALVLLFFREMPVERDHLHTPGIKYSGVRHLRQVVGVDEQLELRNKLKRIFIEKAGVDGVPARQGLNQTGR